MDLNCSLRVCLCVYVVMKTVIIIIMLYTTAGDDFFTMIVTEMTRDVTQSSSSQPRGLC